MVGIVERFAEFFNVFRWVHAKKLVKILAEVLNIIKACHGSYFSDVVLRIDHKLRGPAQAYKADKPADGLPGHGFYLFIQAGMAHAHFPGQRADGKVIVVQVAFHYFNTAVQELFVLHGNFEIVPFKGDLIIKILLQGIALS